MNNQKVVINGSISIRNTPRSHIKQIWSKSDFFNSDVIYAVMEDCIIFKKPLLSNKKATVKPQKGKSGWWHFQIVGEELPEITIDFDSDESDEDHVVVYYRE